MKEDDTKKFQANLGMPDADGIREYTKGKEAEEVRVAKEAKKAEEDLSLILKHFKEHREFLRAVERRSKAGHPIYAGFLYELASSTIEMLDDLVVGFDEEGREKIRNVFARSNASWPVNIKSNSPAYLKRKANFLFDELELGVNSILNVETFKEGGDEIAKLSKDVVRRFILAIQKCQIRSRLDPEGERSEMACLAVALKVSGEQIAYEWFAVVYEWIMHYGQWDEEKASFSSSKLDVLGGDISPLSRNAEISGNRDGDVYCYDQKVKKELRKNLWRAFLQCIKPSIREALSTKIMKEGKFEKVDPNPPSQAQIDEVVELLSSKE